MRLRITSDSDHSCATRVVDADTGKPLEAFTAIRIDPILPDAPLTATADIVLRGGFDLVVDATVHPIRRCLVCGNHHACGGEA